MVAWSTDNLDTSGEPATRSVGTTANLKGKMSKRLSVVKGHFPKLVDCAHFHYDNVEFGSIKLQFANEQSDASWNSRSAKDLVFLVQVSCQAKTWMVRRSYEEFRTLDAHLHQCIYDRRYSQLLPLPPLSEIGDRVEMFTPLLSQYLSRLSAIVDNKLNCGPVLTWMEIDNRGNRFLLKEEASLNVPAIAAAHVIKRYTAQASDEISIEVWSCCRDTQNQMRFTLVAVIVFRFLCHLCPGLGLFGCHLPFSPLFPPPSSCSVYSCPLLLLLLYILLLFLFLGQSTLEWGDPNTEAHF
uniref:PX domain-containing protein n=1 Tax=Hucho hucho TaxID=62062 RepID=A0A4W5P648_9TELE